MAALGIELPTPSAEGQAVLTVFTSTTQRVQLRPALCGVWMNTLIKSSFTSHAQFVCARGDRFRGLAHRLHTALLGALAGNWLK
jgi:hypothetical protein